MRVDTWARGAALFLLLIVLAGCTSEREPQTHDILTGKARIRLTLDGEWSAGTPQSGGQHVWRDGQATLTLLPLEASPGEAYKRRAERLAQQDTLVEDAETAARLNRHQPYSLERLLSEYPGLAPEQRQQWFEDWIAAQEGQADDEVFLTALALDSTALRPDLKVVGTSIQTVLLSPDPTEPTAYFRPGGQLYALELRGESQAIALDRMQKILGGLKFEVGFQPGTLEGAPAPSPQPAPPAPANGKFYLGLLMLGLGGGLAAWGITRRKAAE